MSGSASQTIEAVRTSEPFSQAGSTGKKPMVVGQHQPRQKAVRNSVSLTKKQVQESKESRVMSMLLADRSQPTASVL